MSATGLTAVVLEMLGFFMDIFQRSLSGNVVPLNPPLPYVVNKNPALVVSAYPEQLALEHQGLLWHVQSCTERDTWGGAQMLSMVWGVKTYLPQLH